MLSPLTHRQFGRLRERYPSATLDELASGAALITVPDLPLPAGWAPQVTAIRFIVPVGYPGPTPDCFWADRVLTIGGGVPNASNPTNQIPETVLSGHWFSWHVTDAAKNWNPNRDDLMTYLAIVLDRFREQK